MSNFHSDVWVFDNLNQHYLDALKLYPEDQMVGLFVQGSTNYGLDTEHSDIDTKLILVPSFKELVLNLKPVSTTHVRENNEHIDAKDIRLYIETFRKQNLNFLEILFTDYGLIHSRYAEEWKRLIDNREAIARMNPYRAVKSMKGIAMEKFHAMEHRYPSKVSIIDTYGYDGKQVSHLLRVEDYLRRYISGESYKSCLKPSQEIAWHLIDLKEQKIPYKQAKDEAAESIKKVEDMAAEFCNITKDEENAETLELLRDVQYNIMKIAMQHELENK